MCEGQLSNTFDRFLPQDKIRCDFCVKGLSCQLCSNGPCRISEKTGAQLGTCGIDPDAMAMRDILLEMSWRPVLIHILIWTPPNCRL